MKIPLVKINLPFKPTNDLYMLRLDAIHPEISGNKWFKLKLNLEEAKRLGETTLLTFGGAFSNHIAATAAAGKEHGFKTIGIIRGAELNEQSNKTLQRAKENGMHLHFVSREWYSNKEQPEKLKELKQLFGNFYLLPEGGSNELAVKGCREIPQLIEKPYDALVCPVGTGGTMAGLIRGSESKVIGISVLKGAEYLGERVQELSGSNTQNWEIDHSFHFGGYAKWNENLLKFMSDFEDQHKIPLDPVYTAKMMYGIFEMIKKGRFAEQSTIVAVHTGGLQGRTH